MRTRPDPPSPPWNGEANGPPPPPLPVPPAPGTARPSCGAVAEPGGDPPLPPPPYPPAAGALLL